MRKQKKIAGMIILILASLGLGGCDSREPIQTQPASKGSAESVSAELSSGAVVEILSFSELKGSRFVFSSGAGAWQTELTVAEDGSFQGSFQDVNMGDTGDNYPDGTVYICDFQGQFTEPQKRNDYTYQVQVQTIGYEREAGDEEIVDGVRYCYSDVYGLSEGETILIYKKGAPVSELPEGFKGWVKNSLSGEPEEQLSFYGLYNEQEEFGFAGYNSIEWIKQQIKDTKTSTDALETYIQKEAMTQTDFNISAAEVYKQWDNTLNLLWSVLKETLDQETMEALTIEEREWIEKKERAIREAGAKYEGGTLQPMEEALKGAELTKARVYELLEILED